MGEAVRVAVPGLYLACLPNWGPYYRASQDFIPHICTPPPQRPPPSSGGFTSMCLHAGPKRALGFLLFAPPPAAVGLHLFLPFSFPLPLGLTLMWNALVPPPGSTVCTVFLCMTLYAVSMLKKKKKRRKNTQQNQPTCFGQKKKIEVVFSVSDSELCCCLSVLLASVWPCFARMRYFPLWRILGEEEPHPQRFGGVSDSSKPLGNPGC